MENKKIKLNRNLIWTEQILNKNWQSQGKKEKGKEKRKKKPNNNQDPKSKSVN